MFDSEKIEKDKYKGWSFKKIRSKERKILFCKFLALIPLNIINLRDWLDGTITVRGNVLHRYIDEPILFNFLVFSVFIL